MLGEPKNQFFPAHATISAGCPAKRKFLSVVFIFMAFGFWAGSCQVAAGGTIYILPGYNLIACPYSIGGNTLGELGFGVTHGAKFMKFDNASQTWQGATFVTNVWQPNLGLSPGEGGFLYNPSDESYTINLSGLLHPPVLPVVIPTNRWYLLSRQADDLGTYSNIIGLPPYYGVGFAVWYPTVQGYQLTSYADGFWDPEPASGGEPTVPAGYAVWIGQGSFPGNPFGPTIPGQPQGRTNSQGSSATFSVVANGPPPLSYQWYHNDDTPIEGATGPEYTLANVQSADAGIYRVQVCNVFGCMRSDDAKLTVTPGFAIRSSFGFTNSHFGFSVSNPTRQSVVIQASTNLIQWDSLLTNSTGDSTVYFIDTRVPDPRRMWYRAQRLQ